MGNFVLKRPALGAFSGGGIKVLAYLGALRACEDLKISFAATAGTSGGAIVAALLAAGASASAIENSLKGLNFQTFLKNPISTSEFLPHLGGRVPGGRVATALLTMAKKRELSKLLRHWGLYSSENIQSWLEEELARLTRKSVGTVQFRDLPMPLYVVAADLISARVKVWSRELTPESSVAFAVRTSCSIPLFFQPVHHEGSLLVDGGILSNLPVFVFSDQRDERFQFSSLPVLAFRLASDLDSVDRKQLTTIESLLHILANTVIDGGTSLQTSLQSTIHEISINVGAVKTTDFSNVSTIVQQDLINRGAKATAKRLEEIFSQPTRPTLLTRRELLTPDATQLHFVLGMRSAQREVIIMLRETNRLQKLLPAIIDTAYRGVQVTLITNANLNGDRRHSYRCKLLAQLGVNVKLVDWNDGMLEGLVVDLARPHGRCAVLLSSATEGVGIDATTYTEYSDAHVFPLLYNVVQRYLLARSYTARGEAPPSITAGSLREIVQRLKNNIGPYSSPSVAIEMEEVPLENVFTVVRFVREYKYEQLAALIGLYEKAGVPPFDPLSVRFGSGSSTFVTPPVLEEHGGKCVVIEGSTRTLWHHITRKTHLRGLVVRGCTEGLPGTLRHISEVFLSNAGGVQASDNRGPNRNPNLYRPIERAVHPLDEYPDSDFTSA